MKTLQEKYNAVLEGKYPKSQFVRSAKIEVPRFISPYNGFDDTVQILKNKGMLVEQEQVVPEYDKPSPGVSLEALERGVDYELEKMGIDTATESPTEDVYEKAKDKAEKNLDKDPNYYLHILAGDNIPYPDPTQDSHDREVEVDQKKLFKGTVNPAGGKAEGNTDTFNAMKKASLNEATKKKFAKLLKEGAVEDLAKKLGIPVEKLQASIDKIKKAEMVATAAAAKAAKPTYSETVDEQSKETKFDPRDIKSVSFSNGTEVAVGEPVPDNEGIVISIAKGQNGYEILFKDGSEAGSYYLDLNGEEIDEDDFIKENKAKLNEELAPTGIGISQKQIDDLNKLGAIAGVEVYVRDKDGKNVRTVEYTLTNTDYEKNPDDIDFPDPQEGEIKEAVKKVITHILSEGELDRFGNYPPEVQQRTMKIQDSLDRLGIHLDNYIEKINGQIRSTGGAISPAVQAATKKDLLNMVKDAMEKIDYVRSKPVDIDGKKMYSIPSAEPLNEGRGDLQRLIDVIEDMAHEIPDDEETGKELSRDEKEREAAVEAIEALGEEFGIKIQIGGFVNEAQAMGFGTGQGRSKTISKGRESRPDLAQARKDAVKPAKKYVMKNGIPHKYDEDGNLVPLKRMNDDVEETKGAPKGHYFTKSGNLVKGRLTKSKRDRGARLSDPLDKQRSKVPPVTQYNENFTKDSLIKALGDKDDATIQLSDGSNWIIYNPNSNNQDNADMWHSNSVFAVNKDGDEKEIKYSDIARINEDLDIGHVDDEPGMLKQDAYDIAHYAAKLYKLLKHYESMEGEVDFPHWWQAKVVKARDYISKAAHYLEFKTNEPAIDAQVDHLEEKTEKK